MATPVEKINHAVGKTIFIPLIFQRTSDRRQKMWTGDSPNCSSAFFLPGRPNQVARVILAGLPKGTYQVTDARTNKLVSNELFHVDGTERRVVFQLSSIGEVREIMTQLFVIGHLEPEKTDQPNGKPPACPIETSI